MIDSLFPKKSDEPEKQPKGAEKQPKEAAKQTKDINEQPKDAKPPAKEVVKPVKDAVKKPTEGRKKTEGKKNQQDTPVKEKSEAEKKEEILVKSAKNGDLEAFNELVTIHRGKIYAMIQNMIHNQADSWDLTQEVFVKAWRALPKFEARAKFSTWLYRISHNVVYDWMRKKKINSAGEFDDAILTDSSIEPSARTTPRESIRPDQAMQNSELAKRINDAMSKISPEHRQVITLREIEGYDYKEIAEIMDTTLGTVMSRLFYARKKLQTLLKNER